jgi:peptidoglycan/xylan/chitin deacetylase (PgdA/CDA1 family)
MVRRPFRPAARYWCRVQAIFYHGVIDRRNADHYFARLFTDIQEFDAEIAEVARHWRPMPLAEVADFVRVGKPLPERAVHVSFDDGYRNTLRAAEVLERHGVPWTLFVVVDAVLDGYRPWYARLADALGATMNVQRPDGSVADLSRDWDKWKFDQELKSVLMAVPAERLDRTLDGILRLPGVCVPNEEQWPFLNRSELEQLHAAGVEIGNHSARHSNLTRCDDDGLLAEVEGSRRRLEATLETPIRFFSYPDGRYDRRVMRAVASGHDLAMSVWRPRARGAPLAIPRRLGGMGMARLEAALEKRVGLEDWHEWARTLWSRVSGEARQRLFAGAGPGSR